MNVMDLLWTHLSRAFFQVNGKYVIKSGTDFREFSQITLKFTGDKVDLDVQKVVVDSTVEEEPETKEIVQKYMGKFQIK